MKTKTQIKPLKEFVVLRRRWLRGSRTDSGSALMLPGSAMCCLGFACRAAGMTSKEIYRHEMPAEAIDSIISSSDFTEAKKVSARKRADEMADRLPKLVLRRWTETWGSEYEDTHLCTNISAVNDDDEITDDKREEKLKKLFEKGGIKVVFK